jgi:hypothetical protein
MSFPAAVRKKELFLAEDATAVPLVSSEEASALMKIHPRTVSRLVRVVGAPLTSIFRCCSTGVRSVAWP